MLRMVAVNARCSRRFAPAGRGLPAGADGA